MSLSDDDLMDLQRAGEEKTPPCNHEPKQKITCKYCKKSYCSECQGPFFTRHVRQCQYTSSGGGAFQNRLDGAEPDSGDQLIISSAVAVNMHAILFACVSKKQVTYFMVNVLMICFRIKL